MTPMQITVEIAEQSCRKNSACGQKENITNHKFKTVIIKKTTGGLHTKELFFLPIFYTYTAFTVSNFFCHTIKRFKRCRSLMPYLVWYLKFIKCYSPLN